MSSPITVLPNLVQLAVPTPFPVGPVNVYAAQDSTGLTLVDCGPCTPEARTALETGLDAWGHSIRNVRRIFITHAHADHYGLAGEIMAGAPAPVQVFTHPFNRPTLENYQDERRRRNAFYASLLNQAGVPEQARMAIAGMRRGVGEYANEVSVSGDLHDGDTVMLAGRSWQILHTPGHSSGLVCLYEPSSRVLLSNDHLLRDISSNPLAEPPPPGYTQKLKSLAEYIAQLRRVAAMDISVAWPGHGEPIYDVPDLVRQREAFHIRRSERILGLLDGKASTTYEIAQSLFPRLDPMNFFLAISEVLGHLEVLEMERRITSMRRDSVTVWHTS